jgi:signal peptidase II
MRKYILFIAVTLATIGVDQATKVWARTSLRPDRPPVIEGYWDYRLSQNPRGAFGLNLPGGRWAFVVVGVVALVFIGSYLRKPEAGKLRVVVPLGLIAGGALGNIYDRVAFGTVTDFVLWHWHEHVWPTFNVADAALVAGVIALILFAPRTKKQAGKDARARAAR